MKVVVVGGGFAGCAAAFQAARMGAEVTLLERADMLCGTGIVGGIMRNNGRYTAAEEMIAMGGGGLFRLIDKHCRHRNIHFPGHQHASLFDVAKVPAVVERELKALGVKVHFICRITGVHMLPSSHDGGDMILSAVKDASDHIYDGDVFVDATGTAGPAGMCSKYGNGCAVCALRCPAFGGRVSLSALCGIKEISALRGDDLTQRGAMSGSCKLMKESLSEELQQELKINGFAIVKVPEHLTENHLDMKACQQYALPEYADHLILLDTGHAKLMTPYFPLEKIKKISGFENARFEDPYAGGKGNSIRLTSMVRRDDTMKVIGLANVFCAGEKAGIFVGHTEAIVTGTLAGYNGVKLGYDKSLLELSQETACGDAISWVRQQMENEDGLKHKYTFSGSVLFDRMKEKGLYTTDTRKIRDRVQDCGMENVFAMVNR